MELWIRSQDKIALTKVSNVSLQEIRSGYTRDFEGYGIGTYYDNLQILGKYNSKERALEVLDEIQDKIVINYGYELATNSGIRPDNIKPKSYTAVYEMPKD